MKIFRNQFVKLLNGNGCNVMLGSMLSFSVCITSTLFHFIWFQYGLSSTQCFFLLLLTVLLLDSFGRFKIVNCIVSGFVFFFYFFRLSVNHKNVSKILFRRQFILSLFALLQNHNQFQIEFLCCCLEKKKIMFRICLVKEVSKVEPPLT